MFENERLIPPALVERNINETFYVAELPVPGPLWWRVCALDPSGRPGLWSAVRRLDIIPPPPAASVFSLSFTPPAVAGGESAEGLVTLVEPAPPGGATVALWPVGPAGARAFVPPRVLLPAGSASATFRVDTRPVPADVELEVVAGARNNAKPATLKISAARPRARLASLALNPAVLTAGKAAQGTVALTGPASSAVTVRLASADPERVSVPPSVTIPAGASAANFVVETAHDNSAREQRRRPSGFAAPPE